MGQNRLAKNGLGPLFEMIPVPVFEEATEGFSDADKYEWFFIRNAIFNIEYDKDGYAVFINIRSLSSSKQALTVDKAGRDAEVYWSTQEEGNQAQQFIIEDL